MGQRSSAEAYLRTVHFTGGLGKSFEIAANFMVPFDCFESFVRSLNSDLAADIDFEYLDLGRFLHWYCLKFRLVIAAEAYFGFPS